MDVNTALALAIERLAFSHDHDGHPSPQAVADAMALVMECGQEPPAGQPQKPAAPAAPLPPE